MPTRDPVGVFGNLPWGGDPDRRAAPPGLAVARYENPSSAGSLTQFTWSKNRTSRTVR